MSEKGVNRCKSKRQNFQNNLEAFPRVVSVFGKSKLIRSFQPCQVMQETCIVNYFTAPRPVALRYLEDALVGIASTPGFSAKIRKLWGLRTDDGAAEFHSVLIELWFAAQFSSRGFSVTCEPETTGSRRAEFKVKASGVDVYFEVRNLESSEWVVVGIETGRSWPRGRLKFLNRLIRDAYQMLPYPYGVELQPYDLAGEQDAFAADISRFLVELGELLEGIHTGKLAHPNLPILLPRSNPRLKIVMIEKKPYLKYAWLEWTESFVNRLSQLAMAAQDKIREKGRQLKPDAANVLIIGLPIWTQSRAFAEESLGPLTPVEQMLFVADKARVHALGRKVEELVSAFVFFQPADRIDFYPGWTTVVLNPLSRHPLPEAIVQVLEGI